MDFFNSPPDGFGADLTAGNGQMTGANNTQNVAPDVQQFETQGWNEGGFLGGFPISEDDEALASAFSIDLQTIWASPTQNSEGVNEMGEENDGGDLFLFETPLQITSGSGEAPDSRFSWRSEKGDSQDGGWHTFGIEPITPITPQLMSPSSNPFSLDRAPDSAPPATFQAPSTSHPSTSSPLSEVPPEPEMKLRLGHDSGADFPPSESKFPPSDPNFAPANDVFQPATSRFDACPTLTTILPASSPSTSPGTDHPSSGDKPSCFPVAACFRDALVAGDSIKAISPSRPSQPPGSPVGGGEKSLELLTKGRSDSARAFGSFNVPDHRPVHPDGGGLKNSSISSREEGNQSAMDSFASDGSTGTFVALPGAESGKGWEGPVFGMCSLSERGDGRSEADWSDQDRQVEGERQLDGSPTVLEQSQQDEALQPDEVSQVDGDGQLEDAGRLSGQQVENCQLDKKRQLDDEPGPMGAKQATFVEAGSEGENTEAATSTHLFASDYTSSENKIVDLGHGPNVETTLDTSHDSLEQHGACDTTADGQKEDEDNGDLFMASLRAEARRVSDYLGADSAILNDGCAGEGDTEGAIVQDVHIPRVQERLEYFADEEVQLWGGVRADVQPEDLTYNGMWEDFTGNSPQADLVWPSSTEIAPRDEPDSISHEFSSNDEAAVSVSHPVPKLDTMDGAPQLVDNSSYVDKTCNNNEDDGNCNLHGHNRKDNNNTDFEEARHCETGFPAFLPKEAVEVVCEYVVPQEDAVPAAVDCAEGVHSLNNVGMSNAWASFEDPVCELELPKGSVFENLDTSNDAAMEEVEAKFATTKDTSKESQSEGEGHGTASLPDCQIGTHGAEILPEPEPSQPKPQSSIARLKAAFESRSDSGVPIPIPRPMSYTSPSVRTEDVSFTVPVRCKPNQRKLSSDSLGSLPEMDREEAQSDLMAVEQDYVPDLGTIARESTDGGIRTFADAPAEWNDCTSGFVGAPKDLVWHSNLLKTIFDLQLSMSNNASSQPVVETANGDSYVKSLEAQIQRERAEHAAEIAQLQDQLANAQAQENLISSLQEEVSKLNAELERVCSEPPQKPAETAEENLVPSLREEVSKLNSELDKVRNQTLQEPERFHSESQNTLIATLQEELFQLRVEMCKSSSRPPTAPTTTLSDASTPRRRVTKDLNVIAEGSGDSQVTDNESGVLASPGATRTPTNTPCVTSDSLMAVESPQFIAMERELQKFKAAYKSSRARGAEQLKAEQEAHKAEVYDLMAKLELRNKVHEEQMRKMMEGMNELIMRSDPLGFMPKISAAQYKRYFQLQW